MTVLSTANFNIGELEVSHLTSTLQSESISWKTISLSRGLHRLKISGRILLENDADIKAWEAFWLSIQGKALPFTLDTGNDNTWSNPLFTPVTGAVSISTAGIIGQTQIVLTGNVTSVIAGSKFQIGQSTKVYTITEINKTTKAITFFPALRLAFPASTVLSSYVKPKMQMTKDETSINYGARGKEISFECVEVIE